MDQHTSVGQRIRYWRKRRGIEVAVLAGLVGRSTSWLEKVERGDRVCEKVSVLLALANVLKIGLGDLIGGAELPPNGGKNWTYREASPRCAVPCLSRRTESLPRPQSCKPRSTSWGCSSPEARTRRERSSCPRFSAPGGPPLHTTCQAPGGDLPGSTR